MAPKTAQHTSPFANSYAQLIDQGLSVLPIVPAQKYPGTYEGHKWRPMTGWDKYTQHIASEAETEAWAAWPNAGIGITLGQLSGVVCLDIDTDDAEIVAAIMEVTPPSPVRKVGKYAAGAAFYKLNDQVPEHTQRFSAGGKRVVEILAEGVQCVLPPSVHPSGERYQWLTVDTLDNYPIADLPMLPIGYADKLAKALEPWGCDASETSSGQPRGDEVPPTEINDADKAELMDALYHIDPDCSESDWAAVGMALHMLGDGYRQVYIDWSKTAKEKWDAKAMGDLKAKWRSWTRCENGIGHESIFKMAKDRRTALGGVPWEAPPLPDYATGLAAGKVEKAANEAAGFWLEPTGRFQIEPLPWLIKKHLIGDTLAAIYGDSNVGKTAVLLDMLLCVATGRPWQGNKVKRGVVLYICGEGFRGVNMRVQAWCEVNGVSPESVRGHFYISSQPVEFLEHGEVEKAIAHTATLGVKPVVYCVDTLNRNFGGGADENSTRDMSAFMRAADKLRIATGACVLISHHTGKNESGLARGSSVLRAALDTEMYLKRQDCGINLTCTKQKDCEPFKSVEMEIKGVTLGRDEDGEEITAPVAIGSHAAVLGRDFVNGQKKRLGRNQRIGLEIVRQEAATIQRNDPARTLFCIERKPLIEELEARGVTDRGSRAGVIDKLIGIGVLREVNTLIFEIHRGNLESSVRVVEGGA